MFVRYFCRILYLITFYYRIMKNSTVILKVRISANDAWEVISDLYKVENYMPGVSSSEVTFAEDYTNRSVVLMDGSNYTERILKVDDENRELHYAMMEPSPFPYKNLQGVIKVLPFINECCEISWTCNYHVTNNLFQEIDALLTLIMTLGIKGIEKHCLKMLSYAS